MGKRVHVIKSDDQLSHLTGIHIQGGFLLSWRVHGPLLHGVRGAACREAYTILPMNQHSWRQITLEWSSYNSQITGGVKNAALCTCRYFSQLIVSLKNKAQQSFLHLHHTRRQLSPDGFSSCVALLALDFDSPVSWARRFSDFIGVCSSLAHVSYKFSSVSTRRLCFCFLPIKSLVVVSLFTKLWIVCLLGTLSSQNLCQNFCWCFLADLYFM
jgi:hypothetical protein